MKEFQNLLLAAGGVTILSLTGGIAGVKAEVYDAVDQFSRTSNPSPFWSYQYSIDKVTKKLILLPKFGYFDDDRNEKVSDGTKIFHLMVWRQPKFNHNFLDGFISVGVNKTSLNWTFVAGDTKGVSIPSKEIYVHPPNGGSVALTFTAPQALKGRVTYRFTHVDCTGSQFGFNGINFTVQQVRIIAYRPFVATIDTGSENSISCASLASSGLRSAPIELEKGDEVEFIVRPNDPSSSGHDSTVMSASIIAE